MDTTTVSASGKPSRGFTTTWHRAGWSDVMDTSSELGPYVCPQIAIRMLAGSGPTDGRIDLGGFPGAVIGLGFGYGAYLAEVFRAGIQSIHRGQMEAARSLGMSYFQAMRYVVLPQALRVVLPPLGNDFIAMLKDSSLISVVALPEILQQGRLWVSRTFRAFEGYNTVALFYLVMTLLLSLLVRLIERKTALPGRTGE